MNGRPHSDYYLFNPILFLIAILLIPMNLVEAQQLDETWTLSAGGRTVRANADGSFTISNVQVPDQFGPGGVGTTPDFVSDDFIRIVGYKTTGGITKYVFSQPFQLTQGETFFAEDLTFRDLPPPQPRSIRVTADPTTLTSIGATTQLTTTATLQDGSLLDVTNKSAWTTYRSSNASVATVGVNGLVTAVDHGSAFITATNEGAATIAGIVVSPGDPLTSVEGFIFFDDGLPAVGVDIGIVDGSATTVSTDGEGKFTLAGIATTIGDLILKATFTDGALNYYTWISDPLPPIQAGITDAGILDSPTIVSCLPPANIIGWWPMDNGTFADIAGENDTIRAHINALIAPGLIGNACEFQTPFRPSAGGYIDVSGLFNELSAMENTVEFWISPTSTMNSSNSPMTFFSNSYRFHVSYNYPNQNSGALQAVVQNTQNQTSVLNFPVDILANTWHHVAMVFKAGERFSLYYDGEKKADGSTSAGAGVNLDNNDLLIGQLGPLGQQLSYIGKIDELSVYNHALTDQEVAAIFALDSQGKCRN